MLLASLRERPSLRSDRHRAIGRRAPLRISLVDAPDDFHVGLEHASGDRPDLAITEREAIDRDDRRDLVAAPAEERLLGDVELGAVDLALDHVQPESIRANLLDEGRARDGLEDVGGDRRRDEPALADHEERDRKSTRLNSSHGYIS